MAKELTLVLTEDIEKLTPAMIAFNNEELLAAVTEQLKHYENAEYSEDEINAAKEDRARLNAFCKQLNDARLHVGKIYLAPYDHFKEQVDEVINRVKAVSDRIDATIKDHEAQVEAKKEAAIREYFNSVVGDYAEVLAFDKIFNPKWLNATVKMPAIKKEIDAILVNVKNAMIAIEALDSEDEKYLKSYYFRTLNLSDAIMENTRLQQERERIEKLNALKKKQAAEQPAPTAIEAVPEQKAEQATEQPVTAAETPDKATDRLYTIEFAVTATISDLRALKQFLQDNKIKYEAIRR